MRAPADVAGHTLLGHVRMPEMLQAWLDALGVEAPARVEQYDSGPLLLEAATLGLGVAIVFDTMASGLIEAGRLVRPFDEEVASPLNYWFFCREASLARRPLRRFHDWIFEEVADSMPPLSMPAASPPP